jgi:hypothetical protein
MTNDQLLKSIKKKLNKTELELEREWWAATKKGEFKGNFWKYLAFVGK